MPTSRPNQLSPIDLTSRLAILSSSESFQTPSLGSLSSTSQNTTITTQATTPSYTPPKPQPRPNIKYQITLALPHPKTQHFSKFLINWALIPNPAHTSNPYLTHYCELEIGQAQARYIDRSLLKKLNPNCYRTNFAKSVELLNEGNSDGLALAKQLFNPDGTFQAKHKSQVWGNELNSGAVLVLGYLLVGKEWRGNGVAKKLVLGLIEKARRYKGDVKWMFVKPMVIECEIQGETEEKRRESKERSEDNARAFYRSVGFRRVGGSEWFCFAVDMGHRSRSVAIVDDFDP